MQFQYMLHHNYGNYYNSPRKALKNKATGTVITAEILYNKSGTMQKFKDILNNVIHMHKGGKKPSANM